MKQHRHLQTVVTGILRKIRGSLSQAHLSAKLGLKHNHVYKWESGTRKIQWKDFLHLCRLKKIDIGSMLMDLYLFNGDPSDTGALCKKIFLGLSTKTLSQEIGTSRFRIECWRKGTGPFYLHDFLQILDRFSHFLPDFALYFLNMEEVVELEIDLDEFRIKQFENDNPIFALITRILETKSHLESAQPTEDLVARMLGLQTDEVRSLLEKAAALKIVHKKKNKYLSDAHHVDIRGRKALQRVRFWIEKGLEFCDAGKVSAPDYIFGNLVYTVSAKGQATILDEYLRFYTRVRKIIEQDQGGDLAIVMNYQMLRMN